MNDAGQKEHVALFCCKADSSRTMSQENIDEMSVLTEDNGESGNTRSMEQQDLSVKKRLVIKLKLPKNHNVGGESANLGPSDLTPPTADDLTKFLQPWPAKARSRRIEIMPPVLDPPPFISSCQKIIQLASNIEPATDHAPQVSSFDFNIHPDLDSAEVSSLAPNNQPVRDSPLDSSSAKKKKLELEYSPGKLKGKLEDMESIGSSVFLIPTGPAGRVLDKNQETDSVEISDDEEEVRLSETNIKNSDEVPERTKFSSVEETTGEPAPNTPKRYACVSCHETFLSPQALVGHGSVHSKPKIPIYSAAGFENKTKSAARDHDRQKTSETSTTKDIPKNAPKTYSCKKCFKEFSSFQALGGHTTQNHACNAPDKGERSVRKFLDFDLNELPKEEYEEDPSSSQC